MDEERDTYPVRKRNMTTGVPVRDEPPMRHRLEELEKRVGELEQGLAAISNRDANDLQYLASVIGVELPSHGPQGAGLAPSGFR